MFFSSNVERKVRVRENKEIEPKVTLLSIVRNRDDGFWSLGR